MKRRNYFVELAIICLALTTLSPFRLRAQSNATMTTVLTATQGQTLTYTVIITNGGPSALTNVMFSDMLDPNTTFVNGSVSTTPIAVPDSYSVLGNVSLSSPVSVLTNDFDPDGVGPALTVNATNFTTTNGGSVSLSTNGFFTYNPPPGFEGTDRFNYTLNDGEGFTDIGTVSLNVTGMIWFVTSSGPVGDGRLSNPFNSLAALAAVNNGGVSNPAAGDNIFLYSGNYTGPVTLLNNQKLIGQGATSSLITITGLTPPPGSAALPATGGTRPVIAGASGVTLAAGNTVRGLNINISGGTALSGASVGALAVTEVGVTNTAGGAMNLANGTLSLVFRSIVATGGTNGIRLVNCTGSFVVTGDGALARNGTGGTIQNSAGNGVHLDNAVNVSLARMNINSCQANGLFGQNLNGLVLDWCSLDSNGDATDEGGIRIGDPVAAVNGLVGSALGGANPTRIANTFVRASGENNVSLFNNGGTLTQLEVSNVISVDTRSRPLGADGLLFEVRGSGSATLNFIGCNFTNNFTQGIQASALGQSTLSITVTNCAFTNNNEGVVLANTADADIIFDVVNNRFFNNLATGASGSAIAAVNATTVTPLAIYSGKIRNNMIAGGGIDNHLVTVLLAGAGQNTLQIANNNINAANAQFSGIFVQAGETGSGNLNANTTVSGNTVSVGALGSHGIVVQSRITSTLCAEITNNVSTTGGAGLFGINVRQRDTSTFRLPGFAGPYNSTAAVNAFLQGKNPSSTIGSTVATAYSGGAACVLPLLAASTADAIVAPDIDRTSPMAAEVMSAGSTKPRDATPQAESDFLTAANLQPIVSAARQRWVQTGLTADQLAVLDSLRFEVTGLNGWYLGSSSNRVVRLDRRGNGHGWFIDSTPDDDREFAAATATRLSSVQLSRRVDLLSAVLHEMGHNLGLPDNYAPAARDSVMYGFLIPGERRLPRLNEASTAVPDDGVGTHYLFTPINIGTLPAGKSITITFQATVANPLPNGICVLTNQGIVTAGGGISFPTDDPRTGAPLDPTLTTVAITPSTITATPSSVCAGSVGNQASGSAASAYAWTISNGTITSATNLQTITYTAGGSGSVTLTLRAFNAAGCSAVNSTNVPITSAPLPSITLNPTTVCANYPGNQATASAATSYVWTISNGTITGSTNQQTVTYVAGASGNVTLGLRVSYAAGCAASNFALIPIIPAPPLPPGCTFQTNYFPSITFSNVIQATTMGLAFDGTNYWSCSGGGTNGIRLGQYDASGGSLAGYFPGLDFRSIFTDGNCGVLARVLNDRTIYRMISPGVFTNSGVTLTGGSLDAQSSVVMNGAATEYIATSAGVVSRWSLNGSYLGSVTLQGFGSVSGENSYPQNRGIAAVGNYWLTYNGNRVLSAWDTAGNRVAQSVLFGAGTSSDSSFSFSYCNGKAFVVDNFNGSWRGYDVCGGVRVAVFGAPGNQTWNADVKSKIQAAGIPQVDTFLITAGNPVPTLADLRKYQAVLVFSDAGFNSPTNIGNVLADYVDQGGGVVVATFAFAGGGASYAMQGRFVSGGYSAFTTGTVAFASGLTLVKDLPAHPVLNNVASLNGGSSSYHIAPLAINGSTLVAHWNNGVPLIAVKEVAAGRSVGLNFYPPSSDVLGGAWLSSTDGGRIMANALLWAGKRAPVILSGPSNYVAVVGGTVNFTVNAIGAPPLSFQWRKNGTDLPGATTSNLNFVATMSSAGEYSVVVSNAYGIAFSSNATLAVVLSTNVAINTVDTGWYTDSGYHEPSNPNYIAGNLPGQYYRDWFVFDVPSLPGPIVSAQLRIYTYSIVNTPGTPEIYQLRHVVTPTTTLVAGGSGLTSIYNDLGDGTTYGARAFVPGEDGRFISIPLNQALRTAVAGAAGTRFAIGGEITTLDGDVNNDESVFWGSLGNPGDVQLLLTYGTNAAPTVGYFTDNNPLSTSPAAPISTAGFAPLQIVNIATQDLSGLRILFLDEADNGTISSALLARLPVIRDWVSAGGRLIVHDRSAGNVTPNPFLIGTPGLGTARLETPDIDVRDPASTLVTAGPFGIIMNTSLDGGCNSAHGYVALGSLPFGARAILNVGGNANQIVAFSYPLGAGFVYYCTIPLDYYLNGGSCGAMATNGPAIYTPNVLHYMHALNPPLRLLTPALGSGNSMALLIGNADSSPMHPDRVAQVRVHSTTNLMPPLTPWIAVPNPIVLSNGLLRVDGINATNPAATIYRAVELP
jgi:uncharacterized repeat protein (TIGR01451 family)